MGGIVTGKAAAHGRPAAEAAEARRVVIETRDAVETSSSGSGALRAAVVALRARVGSSHCQEVAECTGGTVGGRGSAGSAGVSADGAGGRRGQSVSHRAPQTVRCVVTGNALGDSRATQARPRRLSRQVEPFFAGSAGRRNRGCAGQTVACAQQAILRAQIVAWLAGQALGRRFAVGTADLAQAARERGSQSRGVIAAHALSADGQAIAGHTVGDELAALLAVAGVQVVLHLADEAGGGSALSAVASE